jgi:hypothetical protein
METKEYYVVIVPYSKSHYYCYLTTNRLSSNTRSFIERSKYIKIQKTNEYSSTLPLIVDYNIVNSILSENDQISKENYRHIAKKEGERLDREQIKKTTTYQDFYKITDF